MQKRNKTIAWAFNQFKNRCLQSIAYRYDRGWAKPTRIIFCLTLRCNIKCRQCAIWRLPNKEEITTDEWKKVIHDLREWIGPYRVQLAGGEIFVRDDIIDIIRFASDHDVLTGVVSNGTMITPELASELADSGLGYIHISLDGIKPETHDYIRGIAGLHAKTMAALDYLLNAPGSNRLSINIATVITKKNLNELADIVKLVDEKGLDGVIFNPLGPTIDSDPDWYKKTDLWLNDLDEVNSTIDHLIKLKKNGAKILNPPEQFEEMKRYFKEPQMRVGETCMVGVTNLCISCDGYIHSCFKMPPLGNVRESTPQKVWDSQLARDIRKRIKSCTIHCSPGNFVYHRSLLSEIIRFIKYG